MARIARKIGFPWEPRTFPKSRIGEIGAELGALRPSDQLDKCDGQADDRKRAGQRRRVHCPDEAGIHCPDEAALHREEIRFRRQLTALRFAQQAYGLGDRLCLRRLEPRLRKALDRPVRVECGRSRHGFRPSRCGQDSGMHLARQEASRGSSQTPPSAGRTTVMKLPRRSIGYGCRVGAD